MLLFVLKFPLIWGSKGIKPLFSWQLGFLFEWVRVFCIKVDDNRSLGILTWKGTCPFHTPYGSCNCDSVPWVAVVVIQSAIQWALMGWRHLHPPPNACDPVEIHFHYMLPEVFLSSVDVVVDVHGRSHNFLLIHPREVLLALCWVIARPLSILGIFSQSLSSGVGLTGVWLVHQSCAWQTPTNKGMPVSDVMRNRLQWRMCDCPH